MAKAKLSNLAKGWVDGKTESRQDIKTVKREGVLTDKVKKTFYLSKEADKLLWHNRAETGETISNTIETLVIDNLKTK